MQAPRVLALCGDESGSTAWRVFQPFAALTAHGFVADWVPKDDAEQVLPRIALGYYDAVITPRIVWPQRAIGERWMRSIHNAGLAIIYEADDDIWSETIVHRQTRLFESERKKGIAQLEWQRQQRIELVQRADGVTVSTPRLRTIVEQHTTRPVRVIPNAIDVAWFRRTLRGVGRIPELEGKLTIGWAGGLRDDLDLQPLVESWGTLARRYPEVHFVMLGHAGQAMVDAVPAAQLHTLPWLPVEEYPRGLINLDIACCIVAPLVFNASKSPIKWFEATIAGIPCVVSKMLYGRHVTDGEDALVATTTEEWTAALERLILDPQLRASLQRHARQTVVGQHSLQGNLTNWLDAWADIIDDFKTRPRLALPA